MKKPGSYNLIRKSVWAMTGYVPGEQPRSCKVIKLNTNENPYPPSPRVKEVLAKFDVEQLGLYPDPVCHDLRETIAEYHNVDIDRILVGNGSDEILALCIRAFVERDGSVGYYDPSYSLYPVLARIEDVAVKPVRLGSDFEWNMPEDYETSLFFLTNPNAPTSLLYPREEVRAFCGRFRGVVVIDEAYVDFSREHCLDFVREFDNVIVARTLSKSFSLAGIRLGYAVGPVALIEALHKIKDSYNVGRLAQELGLAALLDVKHMEGNVERIKITRAAMTAELSRRGIEMFPSETNFLWVKPAGREAGELFERLREDGIFVRYFPGELTGAYLRITVG
ncbi:MAG: histidinol-phosphate transaminase, partial [Thermodesulfobacteriota bacterium]|nr:histidinol-phosphate transaminase [Thermodesulfobacteriota bacterium]